MLLGEFDLSDGDQVVHLLRSLNQFLEALEVHVELLFELMDDHLRLALEKSLHLPVSLRNHILLMLKFLSFDHVVCLNGGNFLLQPPLHFRQHVGF